MNFIMNKEDNNLSKEKEKKKKSKRLTNKELKQLVEDLENKILLKTADFENYRKRIQKELSNTRLYAQISILDRILSVYDLFKMAVAASEKENADLTILTQGLSMINTEFKKVLDDLNITEVKSLGEVFNHELHEAVSEENSKEEKGKIIKEHRCGYKMNGKLIRAASVVVSKGEE